MPTFDFPTLVWWGLPLAAAPVLIHLINLLRHKRVAFAAVELLMAGQKKYRTRVLLRQLVLLALRTAAIVALVLAVAQPRWRDALGGLFASGRGRHVVLLDDSYSMLDRSDGGRLGETTAFERGREAVARLVTELATARGPQELTLGRCSMLAGTDGAGRWDIEREPLTPLTVQRVREELARREAGFGDVGPDRALAAAAEVVGRERDAGEVLWLVGDLRARDWKSFVAESAGAALPGASVSADELAGILRGLAEAGVTVRLVDCGDPAADPGGSNPGGSLTAGSLTAGNLTVERLEPVGGVPAVGVLVPFEVAIRNDGPQPVRDVQVSLREDGVSRPGVQCAEIRPGATATARFDVRFTSVGGHLVEASLPLDAVAADNVRTAVLEVVERVDVLIIDGDPRGSRGSGDAFYVAASLAPGVSAATGLRPRVEPPRALATLDLAGFDTIWLLDCPRLEPAEIAALEAHVAAGGGAVFFAGPRTDAEAVNRLLHRGGAGLFPVPLAGAVDLSPAAELSGGGGPAGVSPAASPDVVVEDHPVVAVLAGQRNPLLDSVRIDRFMAVARDAEPDPAVRRLLSVRGGSPLVVERSFGAGRVAAVLTTAAPTWNNWSRGNPSWVVVMLELESRVAAGRRRADGVSVGAPLVVPVAADDGAAEVDFTLAAGTDIRQPVVATADGFEATLPAVDRPGGISARWRGREGALRERVFAVNVNPEEGRLERINSDRLARSVDGVPLTVLAAADVGADSDRTGVASLARPLLLLLVGMLLLEQLVALFAGYHPGMAPRRQVPAGGTASRGQGGSPGQGRGRRVPVPAGG
jgi:hypothetical protein